MAHKNETEGRSGVLPRVACPMCGTLVAWTAENRWRPFCSERCKKIDLGAWASGAYCVPASDPSPPESEG